MPSRVSLQEKEYYAHPRNAFWWLMAQLLGFDYNVPYAERVSKVTAGGFAVWDVLLDCQREGSLDSNIQRETEESNDFSSFLLRTPTIKLIAFNGTAAQKIFMRHCTSVLEQHTNLMTALLPSSSAAHASMTKYQKLRLWSEQLPEAKKNSCVGVANG